MEDMDLTVPIILKDLPAYILYHTVPGFARVCMELSNQLLNSDRFYGAYDLQGLQAQRFK